MSHCEDCKYFGNNPMLDLTYCSKFIKRVSALQEGCAHFQLSGYPKMNHFFYRNIRKNLCRGLLKKVFDALEKAEHESYCSFSYEETDRDMYDNTIFAFEIVNRILTIKGHESYMHVKPEAFSIYIFLQIRKP